MKLQPSNPLISAWFSCQLAQFLVLTCVLLPGFARAAEKPNVLFILADDLGWSDTTLFGTTSFYKTPNIERLAARGMTFSRAYSSSPLCSPTRASILTGLSPARHGITSPNCHLPKITLKATATTSGPANKKATLPDSVSRLDTDYYTLAEMFHDNGYATGHFGKWHLGAEPYSPLQHGFDVDLPHHPGPGPAGSYVAPWKFKDFDHDPEVPDQHLEDRMAAEAVAFLEQHKDAPFFLNYWMFSVHAPFDAKQKLIDKYQGRVVPDDPQRSPTYAAMIESMDDAVGTLLDTIDRLGIADNTIIVFASDNGGNMYNEVDGTRATSNAPLRGGKATMYEGGVRGPAIIAYPGRIEPGSRSDALIVSSDYYPTLLELLDIQARPEQSFDGISIVPALQGKPLERESIFVFFPHSPAIPDWLPPSVSVVSDRWKLIRIFHGGDNGQHRYKLFNLHQDVGEQHDLAAQMPDRVEQMDQLLELFLTRTKAVLPQINRKFDPSKYDPELEGKGKLKGSVTVKKPQPKQPAVAVAGWTPSSVCKLSLNNGALVVDSSGRDPHLSYTLPEAFEAQSLVLTMSIQSNSQGKGQVFWREKGVSPAFFRDRSVSFDLQHNNQAHEYAVRFVPTEPVIAIRIDPSTGAGRIKISKLQLTTDGGRVLQRWEF